MTKKKTQILQTAIQLFAEQGYEQTPTSQIAQAAGVSEGLIFRHFGTKAGLLSAIIQSGLAQISDTMQVYRDPLADPRAAVLEHIEQSLNLIRTQETFWRLATKIRFQMNAHPAISAPIAEANAWITKSLTAHFTHLGAQSPEKEALLLYALIDAVCLHWLQDPVHYPMEEMKLFLIQKYRHAQF